MNKIEERALKWIAETTGYGKGEIQFSNNSSPDFTLPDGRSFEVKYSYLKEKVKKRKHITIYPRQWAHLVTLTDCTILVFTQGDKPEYVIPMSEIPVGTKTWRDVRIDSCEINKRSVPRDVYLEKVRKNREALPDK